jgi:hypothetical protein
LRRFIALICMVVTITLGSTTTALANSNAPTPEAVAQGDAGIPSRSTFTTPNYVGAGDTPPDDGPRREVKHTFSHTHSQRIHDLLLTLGPGSAIAYCVAVAPNEVKPLCSLAIMSIFTMVSARLGDDECYEVSARLGWPPLGARIVKC